MLPLGKPGEGYTGPPCIFFFYIYLPFSAKFLKKSKVKREYVQMANKYIKQKANTLIAN